MKIPQLRYTLQIVRTNGIKQAIKGSFRDRAAAVAHGDRCFPGRYVVVDRMPGQIEEALKARYPGLNITVI
jgi:hypothetical protein